MRTHSKPILFTPRNPEKYIGDVNNIVMRSSWEKRFALWCDNNPSVIKWNSEGHPIEYFSKADGRKRRYYIDFFLLVRKRDGTEQKIAIEIKPYSQTQPPNPPKRKTHKSEQRFLAECREYQVNQDKWEAARAWCKKNGFEFVIMTEYELGLATKG